VTCLCCHADHHIRADDMLPLDAKMTCRRCGPLAGHPAGAARVRCPGCGLFLLGHDLTLDQRGELRITEGLAGVALRETCKAAVDRAARHREERPAAGSCSAGQGNPAAYREDRALRIFEWVTGQGSRCTPVPSRSPSDHRSDDQR
jgi:hypothetical protein